MFRKITWALSVVTLLLACPFSPSSGATPSNAERILGAYVDALKTADAAKLQTITTSDFGSREKATGYPVLAALGAVISVDVGPPSTFSGSKIYKGTVQHTNGVSTWQFRLGPDDRLMAAAQLLEIRRNALTKDDLDKLTKTFTKTASTITGSGKFGTDIFGHLFTESSLFPNAKDILAKTDIFAKTASSTIQDPCKSFPTFCNGQTGNAPAINAGGVSNSDPRLVEFLFATDRNLTITDNVATLASDTDRREKLTYGAVAVHIPATHQQGRLELPSVWKLFGHEFKLALPGDHYFSIRQISTMSLDDFKQLASQQGKKSALVFVHGFNTSFDDAIYRNAQIVWDLQFKGLSVLYSWDSKGSAADYLFDRDSAYLGRKGFIQLLSILNDDLGIEHINVIAHSMGNLVVIDALAQSAATATPAKVGQLIMAAPDVASDMFKIELPKIQPLTAGTTLYASSADKALNLSGSLADFPRAGYVSASGPIVMPNLDTIDVTSVGSEFLGTNHNEFASNRSVIDDIRLLIEDGKKSPRLAQIRAAPEPPQPRAYWRYAP